MRIWMTIFFAFISGFSFGQNTTTDSLYLAAFDIFETQVTAYYTRYAEGDAAFQTLYVQENRWIPNFPDSINGREVTVLTSKNYKKHYRKKGRKLIQIEVRAMQMDKGKLGIAFLPYHGTMLRNKEVVLYLSDWTNVYFRFNITLQKWEFDKVSNGGI